MLKEPNILKPMLLSPHDLVENLTIELIVRTLPGGWVTEVVPQPKAEFGICAHVLCSFLSANSTRTIYTMRATVTSNSNDQGGEGKCKTEICDRDRRDEECPHLTSVLLVPGFRCILCPVGARVRVHFQLQHLTKGGKPWHKT